jgi:Mn-dependent DtxR family transcriptional regulator
MIGIDDETAHLDAEGIEHHLHPQTIKNLESFIILLKKRDPKLIEDLQQKDGKEK